MLSVATGQNLTERGPRNPAWQIALAFGAKCEKEQSDTVTHIIATSRDTEKCHWAKKKGLHVLHVDWLVQCVRHWSRLKEAPFAIHQIPACDKVPYSQEDLMSILRIDLSFRSCRRHFHE